MNDSKRRTTIFVIDDDKAMLELVSFYLVKEEFDVACFSDCGKALAGIDSLTPALIISDIAMPGMDGMAFYQKVKERMDDQLIPFIFLSAKKETVDIVAGLELGADDYIVKPFDPAVLVAHVKNRLLHAASVRARVDRDALTGIYSRRYFDARIGETVALSDRYGRPFVLAMVDIDHFKRINDTFGHPAGDRMLKDVAKAITAHCRTTDAVCRYGGEEMAVIMPETSVRQAREALERIRRSIEELGRETSGITVSIGYAGSVVNGSTPASLIKRADEALYRSKQSGRNKVTGFGETDV